MPATKLTNAQLVILSTAAKREDRGILLPTNLKGGAAQKLVAKLVSLGLAEEVRGRGNLPVWRRDDDNRPMALRITKRGVAAIAVEGGAGDGEVSNLTAPDEQAKPQDIAVTPKRGGRKARSGRKVGGDSTAPSGRARSKQARMPCGEAE
jgi:hypothetical protein